MARTTEDKSQRRYKEDEYRYELESRRQASDWLWPVLLGQRGPATRLVPGPGREIFQLRGSTVVGNERAAVADLRELQYQSRPTKRWAGFRLPHRAQHFADSQRPGYVARRYRVFPVVVERRL